VSTEKIVNSKLPFNLGTVSQNIYIYSRLKITITMVREKEKKFNFIITHVKTEITNKTEF